MSLKVQQHYKQQISVVKKCDVYGNGNVRCGKKRCKITLPIKTAIVDKTIIEKKHSISKKDAVKSNSRLIEIEQFIDYSLEDLYDKFYFPYTSLEYKEYRKGMRCNELCIKTIDGNEEIVMCNQLGMYELSDGTNKCLQHYDGDGEEISFACIGSNCHKNANVGPPFNSMFKVRCYAHKLKTDTTKNIIICQTKECLTMASYGYKSQKPLKCMTHKETNMEYVIRRRCIETGCSNIATYKELRSSYNIYCELHKKPGSYRGTHSKKHRKSKVHIEEVLEDHSSFLSS